MKKMNNKGFSLVELIVVVAIMAVLVAMLAPQYLRYVERSRLQKDNSAISEVANAVKIAVANDTIYAEIPAGGATIITSDDANDNKVFDFDAHGSGVTKLDDELEAVLGKTVTTGSNTYQQSTKQIKISILKSANGASVFVDGWVQEVADSPSPTTKAF